MQNLGVAIKSFRFSLAHAAFSRSRRRELAATPPPTTMVLKCNAYAAATVFPTSTSTTDAWNPALRFFFSSSDHFLFSRNL